MSSSNLIRLGALAALVSGLLFLPADLLGLLEDPQDPVASVTSVSYAISVGLALIGGILLTGGLVGLYAGRSEVMGVLGLVGFALALAGQVLANGWTWVLVFVAPALARHAPELLLAEPPGSVAFGTNLSYTALGLGWLIFGAAAFRTRAYPRAATVLLVVGSVFLIIPVPLPPVIGVIGGIVFDVAVIWLALDLLRRGGAVAEQPQRVR